MTFYIALNHDEIQAQIPYALVAETMSGSRWNTSKRKHLMKERFTEAEIKTISGLHKTARTWYLYKGVPEEVHMTLKTYDLWHRLANFCREI